jgi:hypothetical protein
VVHREAAIGACDVEVTTILALDEQDDCLARGTTLHTLDTRGADAMVFKSAIQHVRRVVVADAAGHVHSDALLRQINGDIRGAAARPDRHAVDQRKRPLRR